MPGDEELALTVYQALRARDDDGGAAVPGTVKAAGLDGEQVGRAIDKLRMLGLVTEDEDGVVRPVAPETALLRTLDAHHANSLEQDRIERLTRSLVTVYRPAVTRDVARVEVEYITDRRHKDRALRSLDGAVRESCDALHPGLMPPMTVLEASLASDAAMVARGVTIRTIYPRTVLSTTRYARYLARQAEVGVRIRLADHAAYDMLVYDRERVCLPANPDNPAEAMIVVRGSALVGMHVAVFEDYWLRATPYEEVSGATPGELSAQERVIVRLLARGLTDDQIAHRVGVHRRTVQRVITRLMERLGAASRFEAGLRLGRDPELARVAVQASDPGAPDA